MPTCQPTGPHLQGRKKKAAQTHGGTGSAPPCLVVCSPTGTVGARPPNLFEGSGDDGQTAFCGEQVIPGSGGHHETLGAHWTGVLHLVISACRCCSNTSNWRAPDDPLGHRRWPARVYTLATSFRHPHPATSPSASLAMPAASQIRIDMSRTARTSSTVAPPLRAPRRWPLSCGFTWVWVAGLASAAFGQATFPIVADEGGKQTLLVSEVAEGGPWHLRLAERAPQS